MTLPAASSDRSTPVTSSSVSSKSLGLFLYILAAVVAVAILGLGIYVAAQSKGWTLLAAGSVSVVGVLLAWPLHGAFQESHRHAQQIHATLASVLPERMHQMAALLATISEQQLLSDRAKSVAFRDKDRDALRRAIKEDLSRRDWEAALVLVNDMERTFGYAQEAVQFRKEINAHRDDFVRKDIGEATTRIENLCRLELWADAQKESERVMALYSEHDLAKALPGEIDNRRQMVKKQLLEGWRDAIARKDWDSAIEIVKRLDLYLTRPEAEQIQESVRMVAREKVSQLGTQFSLAWQDHRYAEALRVAEVITRDFPNSGIAREVRDKMDVLRQRAGSPMEAAKA